MRRVLRASAKIAAAILVLVVAAAAAVLVYLRTAAGRRTVATRVNAALEPLFAGRLTITQIGAIGFEGADGIAATVVDPDGRTVISVEGAHARIALLTLIRSILGHGEIVVDLPEAWVRVARVDLDANDAGDLRIARAFAPRTVSSGPPGRPVRLTLDDMRLERAHVQGKPNGVPGIDADVAGAQGWLHFRPGSIEIDVLRSTVSEAVVPGVGARAAGTVTTHLTMPSATGQKIGLATAFDGHVGELPLTAAVTLDGEDLDLKADGEHATPQCVRSVWSACPFTEEASLHAHGHGTLPKLDFDATGTLGNGKLEIDKGTATLGAGVSASAHVVFTSVDARAFSAAAPISAMSGSADLAITVPAKGTASGHVEADLAAGRFAGQTTPAAGIHGKVTFDPADPQSLRATAAVEPPRDGRAGLRHAASLPEERVVRARLRGTRDGSGTSTRSRASGAWRTGKARRRSQARSTSAPTASMPRRRSRPATSAQAAPRCTTPRSSHTLRAPSSRRTSTRCSTAPVWRWVPCTSPRCTRRRRGRWRARRST